MREPFSPLRVLYFSTALGFSFSILGGRWTGDHPQEHLAKFGYRSERKVDIFWHPELTCKNLRSKSGYFNPFFSLENMTTLGEFFGFSKKKTFVQVAITTPPPFFLSPSGEISPTIQNPVKPNSHWDPMK